VRKTIRVDLPERAGIAVALKPRTPSDAVDAVRAAEKQFTSAREAAAARLVDVERVRAAVTAGRAATADLERALTSRDAAALLVEPAAERMRATESALSAAKGSAVRRVLEDAAGFRAELQAIADDLAPVLEELRVLEQAIDTAVQAVKPSDSLQPALTWPSALVVDATLRRSAMAAPLPSFVPGGV
jgi:hypothetical protein